MKKIIFFLFFFLFSCGNNDSGTIVIPAQQPKPACYACIAWQPQGSTLVGTILWTGASKTEHACDSSVCDTNTYNCASFTSYSVHPEYDQTQCQ